jgi:hypothetical protein
MRIRPCLRSGLCCKTGPCPFGIWDAERHQCQFLQTHEQGSNYTIYSCGKKAEIEAMPAEYRADFSPAFGAGCCMPLFNTNRAAIAAARNGK